MLFSFTTSSYAIDSDDEDFLFPRKQNNEQSKKRPYGSENYSPKKKPKLNSDEEIKEALYNYSFNTIADLNEILNRENFFDIAQPLLWDHDYNEQTANILCLIIKEKSISADVRLKSASILAKNTGSSFLDNISFKTKGLQACLSILHHQEKWLIDFFKSNPYQDQDYKNLLSFQEDFYIKVITDMNPNNELNWSDLDYKRILHALALIDPQNYKSIIQPIQKNFSDDWSGDNYFKFIQKSFTMIEFAVFSWSPRLRHNFIEILPSIHSEKIDDLIYFIKILAEPFWKPQHYIEIIKTFTSISIKEPQLIANATKKIARDFWTPDHYVGAIKSFNNVGSYTKLINKMPFKTDTAERLNILIEFVNILSTIDWTADHYNEIIYAFRCILNKSDIKYIVDGILYLRQKATHFTPIQYRELVRGLQRASEKYVKKFLDAIISISSDDWTPTHFAEAIKAFSYFPKLREPEHINETALAVKAFTECGQSASFCVSLIKELINLKPEYTLATIDAVQKLSLPIWTELHYPKAIAAFCNINTNMEENNKIIEIIQKLHTNALNDKEIFYLTLNGFNFPNIIKPISFDKIESLNNADTLLDNNALWAPELYEHFIKELGNIIIKCSSEEFDSIVGAIQKISLNDWTQEHYKKIVSGLCTIVHCYYKPSFDKNIFSCNEMIDNYVYILENLVLKSGSPTYYCDLLDLTVVTDCKILVDVIKQYDLTSWKKEYYDKIFYCIRSKRINSKKYASIIKLVHFLSEKEGFNESSIELLIDIANFTDPIIMSKIIEFVIDLLQKNYIDDKISCNQIILNISAILKTGQIDYEKIYKIKHIDHNWLRSIFNYLCHVPEKYRIDLMNCFTDQLDDNSVDSCLVFANYLESISEEDCRSILTCYIKFAKNEEEIGSIVHNLVKDKTNMHSINIAEYLTLSIIEKSSFKDLRIKALDLIFWYSDLRKKNYKKIKQYVQDIIQNGSENDWIIIAKLLAKKQYTFDEYKEVLKDLLQKISSHNVEFVKLKGYVLFGETFREEYNQLIKSDSFISLLNKRLNDLFYECDSDNPRIQELLILRAKANSNNNKNHGLSAVNIYANLLLMLKEDYKHHPSRFSLRLNADQDKMLHFTINEKALSYLFLNQEALASLEDVDFILGNNPDDTLKRIRSGSDFENYFTAPFSEESMMLQAMIKKFKTMGDEGLKKLAYLMHDMDQCFQGKNQAIWDHYL